MFLSDVTAVKMCRCHMQMHRAVDVHSGKTRRLMWLYICISPTHTVCFRNLTNGMVLGIRIG